jgi:Haem-binding domain
VYLKIIVALLIVAFIVIQLFPAERTNPPVTGEIEAPAEVKEIFMRSCYDCHSNETEWPWYAYIAPASWLLSSDVGKGREELNFSEWSSYNDMRKQKSVKEIWKEVGEGEMPEWDYVVIHPEAKLSPSDKETIRRWSEGGGK